MNIAIILSGGVGSRMGSDIPKQYLEIAGTPIILYCLNTFMSVEIIDKIIVVIAKEWRDYLQQKINALHSEYNVYYAYPGETRQLSIFNGLKEAKKLGAGSEDKVIIHDAARPLVSRELILSCLDGCKEADGVLPVIPVKDTLYRSVDGVHITNLLNRSELYAGQAPESFDFGRYLAAHESMNHEDLVKINGSTEIAYKAGLSVKLIKGDEMNFKITTPEDLSNFESIIKREAR